MHVTRLSIEKRRRDFQTNVRKWGVFPVSPLRMVNEVIVHSSLYYQFFWPGIWNDMATSSVFFQLQSSTLHCCAAFSSTLGGNIPISDGYFLSNFFVVVRIQWLPSSIGTVFWSTQSLTLSMASSDQCINWAINLVALLPPMASWKFNNLSTRYSLESSQIWTCFSLKPGSSRLVSNIESGYRAFEPNLDERAICGKGISLLPLFIIILRLFF
jgi:hypothetical protein